MVYALVVFSLACVWLSGVVYASQHVGYAALIASIGAMVLGILFAAAFHHDQE